MASWEVETDLIIHCRVKIVVDADSKDDAIETAVDLMPSYGGDAKWRAKVDLKAPAGIKIRVAKAYHFEKASGLEKARRVAEPETI